jgi:hypothetical protein
MAQSPLDGVANHRGTDRSGNHKAGPRYGLLAHTGGRLSAAGQINMDHDGAAADPPTPSDRGGEVGAAAKSVGGRQHARWSVRPTVEPGPARDGC